MGTVNVILGDGKKLNLILGQQLENAVTAVVFDFSAWQTEFGSGTLGLSVQRHGDTQPYAVVPTVSGTNATWNISELDTAYKGVGEVQVTYTVGSVVKKSTVYKFTVYRSLGENGAYPSPGQTWQEEIEDELADVKQDLAELEGGGLSDDAKQALLDCIAHIALWTDGNGQDYYNALEEALYPQATVSSISCVYTQSGVVYNTDALDSLKSDLVVTANWTDGTQSTVTTYTLSGTLTVGTSTITVAYNGKTTTFTVTVTSFIDQYVTTDLAHFWDGIVNTPDGHDSSTTTWYDLIGTNNLVNTNTGTYSWDESGINFTNVQNQEFEGAETSDTCGGKTVEIVLVPSESQSTIVLTPFYDSSHAEDAYGKICIFSDNTFNVVGKSSNTYSTGVNSLTGIKSISASYTNDTTINKAYSNGEERSTSSYTHSFRNSSTEIILGGGQKGGGTYRFKGKVYAIRIYDKILTDAEIAQNYAVDVARFGLGA